MARRIELSGGKGVVLLDDVDFDRLGAHRWYLAGERYAGRHTPRVEVHAGAPTVTYMHREIVGASAAPGRFVDHINGNPLDNRRANLRLATRAQNNANRFARTSLSGFKGVQFKRGAWYASLKFHGRNRHLGVFASKEAAAAAYDEMAVSLWGDFANLNFPRDGVR